MHLNPHVDLHLDLHLDWCLNLQFISHRNDSVFICFSVNSVFTSTIVLPYTPIEFRFASVLFCLLCSSHMNLHLFETYLGAWTSNSTCVKHHGWPLHKIVLVAIHSVNA